MIALPFTYTHLRCHLVAEGRMSLPPQLGSGLRGVFGRALRQISCLTRFPTCENCSLRLTCPYPQIFAPYGIDITRAGFPFKSATVPPPYLILPALPSPRQLKVGERMVFDMLLFGHARASIALIVEAWRQAVTRGLGTEGKPLRLTYVEALDEAGWQVLYESSSDAILPAPLAPPPRQTPLPFATPVTLNLISPLRWQQNGKRASLQAMPATRLLLDITRRLRLLALASGEAEAVDAVNAWPISAWHDACASITVKMSGQWQDFRRYSTRQQQVIPFGGWLGHITIPNAPPILQNMLILGQITSIGKECPFGFGRYRLAFTKHQQKDPGYDNTAQAA